MIASKFSTVLVAVQGLARACATTIRGSLSTSPRSLHILKPLKNAYTLPRLPPGMIRSRAPASRTAANLVAAVFCFQAGELREFAR